MSTELNDLEKVDFSKPPSEFPKGEKGNRRLYFEVMLLRHEWNERKKNPKYRGFDVSYETLVNYYCLLLDEIDRRGLARPKKHHELDDLAKKPTEGVAPEKEVKKQKSNTLYLVAPHARWIWTGEKKLILKEKKFPGMLNKKLLLAGPKHIYGTIILTSITPMNMKQVEATRFAHKVTQREIKSWWGEPKTLYAYTFKFTKYEKPKRYGGPPTGVQTFFYIKKAGALSFKFLGTCSEKHFPRSDPPGCDQCKEEAKEPKHRKHSSLLINEIYMLDAGRDWTDKIPDSVKYILITHAHPDHVGAIVEADRRIKAEIHGPRGLKSDIAELYGVTGLEITEHRPYGSFKLGNMTFEFIPVYHSTRAPTHAIKVDNRLMYAPDFLGFKKRGQLEGVDVYIGDGSSIKRDIRRKGDVGHMSAFNQIRMCAKAGVKHFKLTHVGHVYVTYEDHKATLRIFAEEEGLYKDPEDVYVARDGAQFTLKPDGSIRKGVGSFMKPNKPNWRIFKPEEVFQIKGFSLPAEAAIKIDGMRIQIHTGSKIHLYSEDEGYEKARFLKKAVEELESKFPKNSVFDAEGVMVKDGQPLHRTSFIGYVNGKEYEEEKDEGCQLWIFDVLFYEGKDLRKLPRSERRKYLAKLPTTAHIKPLKKGKHFFLADSKEAMLKAIDRVRDIKGSEGAMIYTDESTIQIKDIHNKGWAKLKNLKEVDCLVLAKDHPRHKKGPLRGKPMKGTWNYYVGAGPYPAKCAKIVLEKVPKNVREYKGKVYAYLGRTFNTSIDAPVGEIIRIWSPEINRYPVMEDEKETGCYYFGVFQPRVLEWVRERHIPDSLNVLMNLSAETLPRKEITSVTPGIRQPIYSKPKKPKLKPEDWKIMEDVLDKQTCSDKGGHWITLEGRKVCAYPVKELDLESQFGKERPGKLEEYDELAKEGEPLPAKYYKWQPECKTCRFVLQRHWPTGKLIPIEEEEEEREEAEDAETRKLEGEAKVDLLLENWTMLQSTFVKDFLPVITSNLIRKFRDHVDLRLEIDSTCIGVTIHPPIPRGKNAWDAFKARIRNRERTQCTAKFPHPKSWLDKEGKVVFPTLHEGARRLSVGMMEIVDKGEVKFGVNREDLHEWFFYGKYLKGRWVLRRLRVGLKKPHTVWILMKPEDQKPLDPIEHSDSGKYKIRPVPEQFKE